MSYYTKITPMIIFLIIPFILLSKNALALDDPLYQICSNTLGNFTYDNPYQNNLNTLLTYLQSKTPPSGFSLTSIGKTPQKVNGLALCRGDANSTICNACVLDASAEIRKRCPYNKQAIIWYDNCMIKYSNLDFFGKIDLENKFYLVNVMNISNDPMLFNKKVKELLSKLSEGSGISKSRKLYGASEMKLDRFTNLYGLVQCTRDLSSKDCKVCLDEAISKLPSCCDGRQGGRVVAGSCNVRYEIYPFVKQHFV